jgi:Fe2+ transport system protein FeoA
MDRSFDHVARVRAAKEAAQRKMEEFGDVSEYDITIIHGQLKEEPIAAPSQPSLDLKGEEEV